MLKPSVAKRQKSNKAVRKGCGKRSLLPEHFTSLRWVGTVCGKDHKEMCSFCFCLEVDRLLSAPLIPVWPCRDSETLASVVGKMGRPVCSSAFLQDFLFISDFP